MSETGDSPAGSHPERDDAAGEEVDELVVDITEDNLVLLQGGDWEIMLSPQEARALGEALIDAAEDAEGPTE